MGYIYSGGDWSYIQGHTISFRVVHAVRASSPFRPLACLPKEGDYIAGYIRRDQAQWHLLPIDVRSTHTLLLLHPPPLPIPPRHLLPVQNHTYPRRQTHPLHHPHLQLLPR